MEYQSHNFNGKQCFNLDQSNLDTESFSLFESM